MVAATVEAKRATADWHKARTARELGKLVDRGAFEAACEDVFAIAREGFRNLPARVGAAIADGLQVDARKVYPILEDECGRIVQELVEAVVGLAERVESAEG